MKAAKGKMGVLTPDTCCKEAIFVANRLQEIIENEGYEVVGTSNVNDLVDFEKAIMLLDAEDDRDNFVYEVERLYEIFEDPIYVIVNFEKISYENRPYLEGIIPNILIDRDVVNEISNAKYEAIFFSCNGGDRAFRDVIHSDTADLKALTNLL